MKCTLLRIFVIFYCFHVYVRERYHSTRVGNPDAEIVEYRFADARKEYALYSPNS